MHQSVKLILFLIVAGQMSCKKLPAPTTSQTRDLSTDLVNTTEPTSAECTQYHQVWSQYHPEGIANPAIPGLTYTYEDVKLKLSFCPLSPAQIEVMRGIFASFQHRMVHLAWHQVRSGWNLTSFATVRQSIEANYPELVLNQENLNGRDHLSDAGNLQGVDFLWMHRTMFEELNNKLQAAKLPPVVGWKVLPRPTSALFPPEKANQQDTWARLEEWETLYQSDSYIRDTSTLSEYGFNLESTIHNNMHMYFKAGQNFHIRIPLLSTLSEVSATDAPHVAYNTTDPTNLDDYLGSPTSSAVNPTFWKLHGWINDRIQDYLKLHPEICFYHGTATTETVPSDLKSCTAEEIAAVATPAPATVSPSTKQAAVGLTNFPQKSSSTTTTPDNITKEDTPTVKSNAPTSSTTTPSTSQTVDPSTSVNKSTAIDLDKLFIIHPAAFHLHDSMNLGTKPANLTTEQKNMLLEHAQNLFPFDATARLQPDGSFILPLSGGQKKVFDINSIKDKKRLLEQIRNGQFPQPTQRN